MEEYKEVKTINVDYRCPQCNVGYLRPTGTCLPVSSPMFPHKCTNCEYGETFVGRTYPRIVYQ